MATAIAVPRPGNEAGRLAALRRYGQLDASAEQDFDLLTRVAAEICGVPYALISLIDEDHVTGMASVGMPNASWRRRTRRFIPPSAMGAIASCWLDWLDDNGCRRKKRPY